MTTSGATSTELLAGEVHAILAQLLAAYRRNDFQPALGRDLTLVQLSLMSTLLEHGPMRMTDLARRHRVRVPTVTVAVRRLPRIGMVKRDLDPSDRRAILVEVTSRGAELHQESLARREAFLSSLLMGLSAEDRRLIAAAISPLRTLGSSDEQRAGGSYG